MTKHEFEDLLCRGGERTRRLRGRLRLSAVGAGLGRQIGDGGGMAHKLVYPRGDPTW
jgi:hypothetical protein